MTSAAYSLMLMLALSDSLTLAARVSVRSQLDRAESRGIRQRRNVQQARAVEEAVATLETQQETAAGHTNVQLTPIQVQQEVSREHPELGPVEITQPMVLSAEESHDAVDHFSQETAWRDPDALVQQTAVPRPSGYHYPGHHADPADRHTYLAHLDALLTEAAFMEHEETREEWEKHAILCEQGFTTASGKTTKPDEMHMDEDITQSYEGDGSLRLGTLDGKVELIFHHPRHSVPPPPAPVQMFEFECENCRNQDGSGGSQSMGRMFKSGESLKFVPKASTEPMFLGAGLAQLAAPGLFSYSFTYDAAKSGGDRVTPGHAAKGVEFTVEESDGKITRIKVSGKTWESSHPDAMTPEQHAYHCEAATINRHRKKVSITSPPANIPVFPNMLGDFEVEALEHDESIEDAAFLKVTITGCGPCSHSVVAFNENKCGLQEVSSNGHPCSQKADEQCPAAASRFGTSYGTWYFTTKKFESEVKPMLDVVEAEMEMTRGNVSSVPGNEVYWDMQELIARIRDQELKFPFNHKMERMDLHLEKCTINMANRVTCSDKETRYTHDAMLMQDSAEKMMVEYVKASPSKLAPPYGVLEPVGTRQGLSFEVFDAALKGGINWHVALVKYGQCTPAMQDWLFVGIGQDSKVDVDLGLMFWQKSGNSVIYKDHLNYQGQRIKFRGAAEYSGDNRNGAGEGDDEWMALNLRSLRQDHGIDYITVHVNIFSGSKSFSSLEGAFLRFVEVDDQAKPVSKTMDPKTETEHGVKTRHPMEDGKTVQYMDIDAAKGSLGSATAGLFSVLFTSPDSQKALPEEMTFKLPPSAHFQIVQVGMPLEAVDSLHNSTSVNSIKRWWQSKQETTLADKKQLMKPVNAFELGQDTEEAQKLNELPAGRDPLSNEIAVEEFQRSPEVSLTPLDKELEAQSVHMGGENKYILEDGRRGVCIHMRQGKDLQPQLYMEGHCGTGGNAVEWQMQMGENGGTIPQADVQKCMVPSGTGVIVSSECEHEWRLNAQHGGGYELQHTASGQCLGYVDPSYPSEIVMVPCSSPNTARLNKMLAIKGLYDNLLVEFPGGPPGTDSFCIKNR